MRYISIILIIYSFDLFFKIYMYKIKKYYKNCIEFIVKLNKKKFF